MPWVARRWRRHGVVLALVSALAGCETQPLPVPPVPPPIPLAATVHPPPVKRRVRPPPPATQEPAPASVPAPEPDTASSAAPASDAASPAVPPPSVPASPSTVVGLSQSDVRALLGEPAAAGESGPARPWTYRNPACSLIVSFFYDVTRGAFFALSAHAAPLPEAECLGRLHGDTHAS